MAAVRRPPLGRARGASLTRARARSRPGTSRPPSRCVTPQQPSWLRDGQVLPIQMSTRGLPTTYVAQDFIFRARCLAGYYRSGEECLPCDRNTFRLASDPETPCTRCSSIATLDARMETILPAATSQDACACPSSTFERRYELGCARCRGASAARPASARVAFPP